MALPTLAVATPLGFRVWNPRDQIKVEGLSHVSLANVLRIGSVGAEAALTAEAGRGVYPLHKRLPKGRPPKGRNSRGKLGVLPRHADGRVVGQGAAARGWFSVWNSER